VWLGLEEAEVASLDHRLHLAQQEDQELEVVVVGTVQTHQQQGQLILALEVVEQVVILRVVRVDLAL
jgi:hypothetical protein